jgi:hypothetical protein
MGGTDFIIYTVDLTTYEQSVVCDGKLINRLDRTIRCVRHLAHSSLFKTTNFIVLLVNVEKFGHRLLASPLEAHFSAYEGGNDMTEATNFIGQQFDANRDKYRSIDVYYGESWDKRGPGFLQAVIRDAKVQSDLARVALV